MFIVVCANLSSHTSHETDDEGALVLGSLVAAEDFEDDVRPVEALPLKIAFMGAITPELDPTFFLCLRPTHKSKLVSTIH
jgi:hypothetical protein